MSRIPKLNKFPDQDSKILKRSRSLKKWLRCQAKFLTCEISEFTPCVHAQTQSSIIHIKYAEKIDDWCLGIHV